MLRRLPLQIIDINDLLVIIVRLLDRPQHEIRERERHEEHDPRREVLVQERGRDRVHAERACGARGLQGFVHACVPCELEGVVRECGHDPVCERLVARVREVVCVHIPPSASIVRIDQAARVAREGDVQKK